MAVIDTQNFGRVTCQAGSGLEFPRGLPGFEERRGFVALRFPASDPIVYLQSVEDPALCFITLPVLAIDSAYRLELTQEEAAVIGTGATPRIGEEALCLAVVSVREEGPTANLLAPIVVNPSNRRAVQAVQAGSGYAIQHPLLDEEAVACS